MVRAVEYDLIIIGGGSAGVAVALEADRRGKRTLLLNAGLPTGGTCVNVGCVPSKYLLYRADMWSTYREVCNELSDMGVNAVFDGKIPDRLICAIQEGRRRLVDSLRRNKYENVLRDLSNVTYLPLRARFIDAYTVETEDGKRWRAPCIIIATGASPCVPPIPGLEDVPFYTSQTIMELNEVPRHLIVLGAGFVGLEMAQVYRRLGAAVTVVDILEERLLGLSERATSVLVEALATEGINFKLGMRVEGVRSQKSGEIEVTGTYRGRSESLSGTHLLVATGRKPNTEGLNLDAAGVETLSSGHIRVNEYLQTSQPHIYAVGDCNNLPPLVYTAAFEGKVAVQNAFACCDTERTSVDYSYLPVVVFTDPQVAWCGLTQVPPGKQDEYEDTILDASDIPACVVRGHKPGFIRIIRHRGTDCLAGAELVMENAGEVIGYVAMAIRFGLKVSQLREVLFPYLTFSEAFRLGLISFERDVRKLTCCAS